MPKIGIAIGKGFSRIGKRIRGKISVPQKFGNYGGEFIDDFAPSSVFEPKVRGKNIEFKYGLASLEDGGVLSLVFKVEEKGKGIGRRMFNSAMSIFGDEVKAVQAYWSGTGDMADNYNTFMKLYAKHGDDAVWKTFTGKMAKKHGFTKIIGKVKVDKANKKVEVLFGN